MREESEEHGAPLNKVKWPCSVCNQEVGIGSIQCSKCCKWVHGRCSGIKGKLPLVNTGFVCKVCQENGHKGGAQVSITKMVEKSVHITIDGEQVEQVDRFRYLGSVIAQDGGCLVAIKERRGMAKDAFYKRKELIKQRFNKGLKKKIVKCLV